MLTSFSPSGLTRLYQALFEHFGPQHWWPADSPFEVVIGAILTQNTNWGNVEKALHNLRQADALSLNGLKELDETELQALIRPSGFFRQKATRINQFIHHLQQYDHDLSRLLQRELPLVRSELLSLNGIGPETADSILLYAGGLPSFVIDAYTVRLLQRLGLIDKNPGYELLRLHFMNNLPHTAQLFNEYHALIVQVCKHYCQKRQPRCTDCPLRPHCQTGSTSS